MAKKIYAVDSKLGSSFLGALSGPMALLGAYGRSVFGGTVVSVASVADMVAKVRAAAGGDKIYNLMIFGHGSPACQSVGCGTAGDVTGDYSLRLDAVGGDLIGAGKALLPTLAPLFTKDAIVLLGGCNVGGKDYSPTFMTTTDGQDLLKAVSKALGGIYTEASDFYQLGPSTCTLGKTIRCNSTACYVSSRLTSLDRW